MDRQTVRRTDGQEDTQVGLLLPTRTILKDLEALLASSSSPRTLSTGILARGARPIGCGIAIDIDILIGINIDVHIAHGVLINMDIDIIETTTTTSKPQLEIDKGLVVLFGVAILRVLDAGPGLVLGSSILPRGPGAGAAVTNGRRVVLVVLLLLLQELELYILVLMLRKI